MPWRPVPPETAVAFERLVPVHPAVARRPMFGCPCAFASGNMFLGAHEETILLRLPSPDREAFLALPGAAPFTPMGRPMREYVAATGPLAADVVALAPWVERSLAYALSLPAKARKARRTR